MSENNLEDTIRETAEGPAKAAGDSGSMEQHKLPDQIAADKVAFDTKNTAFQTRADDWNTRNHAMDTTAAEYDMDLESWKKQCGGRNYREIDEKVIRSGG